MSLIETWNGLEIGTEYPIGTIIFYSGADIGGGDTANIFSRTNKISTGNGDGIDFGQGDWYVANDDGDGGAVPDLIGLMIRGEDASGNEAGDDDAVVILHDHDAASTGGGAHNHFFNDTEGEHTHSMQVLSSTYIARIYSTSTSYWWSGYWQDQWAGHEMDALPSHTHTISGYDSHDHDDITNLSGSAAANANIPHYYNLIPIIKMA